MHPFQMAIAGAYYPNYFVHVEINEELASKELSGFNPRTTVMVYPLIDYFKLTKVFWFQNPSGAWMLMWYCYLLCDKCGFYNTACVIFR